MRSGNRTIFLLVLLCFAFLIPATATPVVCPTSGTFATLLATNSAGGCTVADKLFSDFAYQPSSTGNAPVVDAANFTFTTISSAPAAIGFQFGFSLTALAGQTNDILVSWLVTGPNITSNHLAMAGGALGNAVASIIETYCLGGPVAGCPAANSDSLITYSFGDGPSQVTDSASFGAVTKLGVLKDINVAAGAGGFATISGMVQTVDQSRLPNDNTPEPATMFVAGGGLLALGYFRRRRSL